MIPPRPLLRTCDLIAHLSAQDPGGERIVTFRLPDEWQETGVEAWTSFEVYRDAVDCVLKDGQQTEAGDVATLRLTFREVS